MMPGKVTVLKHPIVNSRIADLRQTGTPSKEFRQVSYVVFFALCDIRSTPMMELARINRPETFESSHCALYINCASF